MIGVRLVRTRGGEVVHRAECRHAAGGTPWHWAEGRPLAEWTGMAWLRACRVCRPDLPRVR